MSIAKPICCKTTLSGIIGGVVLFNKQNATSFDLLSTQIVGVVCIIKINLEILLGEMMTNLYPENIKTLTEAVLNSEGILKSEIRHRVEAQVAKHGGASRQAKVLPDELITYVDKIAFHAYKITDEDIENLKRNGYSEDEIFEITISAALGAGVARIEHSLNLLEGV